MDSLHQLRHHRPLHFSANRRRPSFSKPISSLSFRAPPLHPPSSKFKPIRASSSSHKPLLSSILRNTCVAIASAALLFTRLHYKPAIAAPVTAPLVEPSNDSAEEAVAEAETETETDLIEEQERALEEHLSQHPDDAKALRSLAEVRIQGSKIGKAIEAIDRLIELQPEETEWPLLKYHLYVFTGELEAARKGFEELLEKDPLLIQPYLGLVALASEQGGSVEELTKRIEVAMERCEKERTKSDVRDFKLLIAQLKVIEKNYNDALKLYQELVKEEPKDFRPYLCQGIIYTLLGKTDEAEKQFKTYRRLVPKNHPYAEYFDDNVTANKVFPKKMDS